MKSLSIFSIWLFQNETNFFPFFIRIKLVTSQLRVKSKKKVWFSENWDWEIFFDGKCGWKIKVNFPKFGRTFQASRIYNSIKFQAAGDCGNRNFQKKRISINIQTITKKIFLNERNEKKNEQIFPPTAIIFQE
jgi:hypothetical protein